MQTHNIVICAATYFLNKNIDEKPENTSSFLFLRSKYPWKRHLQANLIVTSQSDQRHNTELKNFTKKFLNSLSRNAQSKRLRHNHIKVNSVTTHFQTFLFFQLNRRLLQFPYFRQTRHFILDCASFRFIFFSITTRNAERSCVMWVNVFIVLSDER